MNKIMSMAAIGLAVSLSANVGARAAAPTPDACATRAPVSGEANQIGARNVQGEANQIGARNVEGEANQFGARNVAGEANKLSSANRTGGEDNPVYPTKTMQLAANTDSCAQR